VSATTVRPVAEHAPLMTEAQRAWRIAAIALLSTRIIQGFIYWGGGSRRFIYGPSKLDSSGAHSWMANKFQTAMPGALLGMDHVISFMLQHFYLLYAGIILFSAAELVVGLMLMAGLLTRVAALASMGFSVLLMLMFGWQGATCIDEWTMAACNLAMGTTLLLAGGGAYSLDNVLLRRNRDLAGRSWFRWASGSLPLPQTEAGFRQLAFGLLAFVLVFNIGTYSYYRGSVLTPFHGGPVSPTRHHLALSQATLLSDGAVRFHVYLDGGTPEAPVHVVAADLLDSSKHVVADWSAASLSKLPNASFTNDYAYNKFGPVHLEFARLWEPRPRLPCLLPPEGIAPTPDCFD
jgi:thiosulfate dehydrogenase [quinone] large subunit